MKQPHTEQSISHTDDQQNTGNHHVADAKDKAGADRLGGTRAGAENVEPTPQPDKQSDQSSDQPAGSPS